MPKKMSNFKFLDGHLQSEGFYFVTRKGRAWMALTHKAGKEKQGPKKSEKADMLDNNWT